MAREISTYYAEDDKGKAVVGIYGEILSIDYYDNHGKHFYSEEYPDKTLVQVQGIAEDWALGYRSLA